MNVGPPPISPARPSQRHDGVTVAQRADDAEASVALCRAKPIISTVANLDLAGARRDADREAFGQVVDGRSESDDQPRSGARARVRVGLWRPSTAARRGTARDRRQRRGGPQADARGCQGPRSQAKPPTAARTSPRRGRSLPRRPRTRRPRPQRSQSRGPERPPTGTPDAHREHRQPTRVRASMSGSRPTGRPGRSRNPPGRRVVLSPRRHGLRVGEPLNRGPGGPLAFRWGSRAMPCLVVLVALISPRLALFAMWLFSDVLVRRLRQLIVPLLGLRAALDDARLRACGRRHQRGPRVEYSSWGLRSWYMGSYAGGRSSRAERDWARAPPRARAGRRDRRAARRAARVGVRAGSEPSAGGCRARGHRGGIAALARRRARSPPCAGAPSA